MTTCKITILDEVNVKISNLDLETRKALVKKFKYEDPSARYLPSVRLGRWDGSVSFFGLGGNTYLGMLPEVLEYLEQNNYYIELEDLRTPFEFNFQKITTEFWGNRCWPVGHRFAGQPIRLREDQVEAVNKFLENPQAIQCLATGFGKTITTATLVKLCEPYGRTVVIVPNKSLVEQTEEDFINCGLSVGVYYGDRKELNRTHTICTWQSLNALEKKHQETPTHIGLTEFFDGVNTILIDEVHQAKANVLQQLLTKHCAHAPIRWGFTGTIPKDDISFQRIRTSIGEVVHEVHAHELQEQGVLSSCNVNIIQTAEWKEFKSYAEELKYLVTDTTRMGYVATLIKDISQTGNTLVLVDRIECGKFLQNQLSNLFSVLSETPDVAFVSGAVKSKDRKESYDEIKTADNKIIIATYGVAAVGINIPRIFNLVLIEPGKSFVRVIQSIGRGIRKADDKDHVEIWDITATTKYAKRHLTERKRYYKESKYPFTVEKTKY